jgi:hypothetical protein
MQVAEITELNCYNRYFLEERYATPGNGTIIEALEISKRQAGLENGSEPLVPLESWKIVACALTIT